MKKRSNSQFQGNAIFKALCICNTNENQEKFLREAPQEMRCNVVYVSIVHFREVKISLSNHLLELPKTFDAEDQSDDEMSLDSSLFPDKENYKLG